MTAATTPNTHRVIFGWSAYEDFHDEAAAVQRATVLAAIPASDPLCCSVRVLSLTDGVPYPTVREFERPQP